MNKMLVNKMVVNKMVVNKRAMTLTMQRWLVSSLFAIHIVLAIMLPSLAASMPCPEAQRPEEHDAAQAADGLTNAGDTHQAINSVPVAEKIDPPREPLISNRDGCESHLTTSVHRIVKEPDRLEKRMDEMARKLAAQEWMLRSLLVLQFLLMLLVSMLPLLASFIF